jgi:DNA-binding PadR family transcriptional regulator
MPHHFPHHEPHHRRHGPGHGRDRHEGPDDDRRFARGDRGPGEHWLDRDDGGRHGHGPGHGRHRGPRHGPHGARFLEHGDLRFVILDLIASKPRHGYEIIKAIEDSADGAYSPSPGVVYPTLTLLAELGHASVAEEAGRKLYALTPAGIEFLEQNRAALRAVQGRIAEIRASRADEPPAALVRAMENVKLALRLRLARGSLPDETIKAIAAALDAAAQAVEGA